MKHFKIFIFLILVQSSFNSYADEINLQKKAVYSLVDKMQGEIQSHLNAIKVFSNDNRGLIRELNSSDLKKRNPPCYKSINKFTVDSTSRINRSREKLNRHYKLFSSMKNLAFRSKDLQDVGEFAEKNINNIETPNDIMLALINFIKTNKHTKACSQTTSNRKLATKKVDTRKKQPNLRKNTKIAKKDRQAVEHKHSERTHAHRLPVQGLNHSHTIASKLYHRAEQNYKNKQYKSAIKKYARLLQNYKSFDKLPDSALKLGYCFYELENWEYARRAFNDVIKYFPNSKAVQLAKFKLKLMKESSNNSYSQPSAPRCRSVKHTTVVGGRPQVASRTVCD